MPGPAASSRRIPAPWRVTLAVLAFHTLWIGVYLAQGHELRDFAKIGLEWVTKSTVSDDIVVDPGYDYPEPRAAGIGMRGYDGQFAYFMAIDPLEAHHYMDMPAYRYSRVLYPAAAYALAGGSDDLVPFTLLLVNWLAIGAGTLLVARYLRRHGSSEWWAVAYGLAPGMLIALQRDLTEPLAYALAAAGVLVLTTSQRRSAYLWAAVIFALAALARQTTLVIPAVFALALLLGYETPGLGRRALRPRIVPAVVFAVVSAAPFVIWSAVLAAWLGDPGRSESYDLVPFRWLFAHEFGPARQPPIVLFLVVPGLVWTFAALQAARRGHPRPIWIALAVNVLAFLVVAPPYNAYTSVGRIMLGAVLMAIMAIPYLDDVPRTTRRALFAASALWALMTPVVALYGLAEFRV